MTKSSLSNYSQITKSSTFIKSLLSFVAVFTISSCITIHAESLDYKETKVLTLNAKDIQLLNIEAAAGFLIVEGLQDSAQIEVTADILAFDDDIKLSLELKGNTAILVADASQNNTFGWSNNNSPKIDLTIKVPASINLIINDGSGSIEIDNVNQITELDDGSGSISITQVAGNVKIDDGSGSLTITNIGGNLDIEDGSGGITANNIGGYINIEDGSGSMDITSVTGLVTIDDGSGNINVNHLKGGLTIIEEGSGRLKMRDVKGPVTID